MKIIRSSKCSLKFANKSKLGLINLLLVEYSKAVNYYIDLLKCLCFLRGKLKIILLPIE